MARPTKQGIDYFPLGVDFLKDLKVRKIMRACGPDSPTILISLLSNIYCDYGYFVAWDNDMSFLISDEVGVSEGAVNEVIKKALQVDFFNNELYTEFSILTSRGIQKRFFKATERRKQIEIVEEYCVVNINEINVNINFINVGNNPINVCKVQQSKVKKSKVNNSVTDLNTNINKDNVGTGVPTSPKSKCKKIYDPESIPYKCSQYLADKILAWYPNANAPKDGEGLQKWCVHIDRLLHIDKKDPDELRHVLAFATKDPFWSSHILSTAKFREKYTTLYGQMMGSQRMKAGNGTNLADDDSEKRKRETREEIERRKKQMGLEENI